MAYNVENLFDTKHDAGKDDWAFLPLAQKDASVQAECNKIPVAPWRDECLHLDWNDQVLEQKLKNVSQAILSVNNGHGPDVLLLEEVENIGVLNQLNAHLQAAGYTSVILIEGNDDRGIDQAMLSRLPIVEQAVNDPIPLDGSRVPGQHKDASKTRGLLHATFGLPDGTPLTVFGVHLPSGNTHELRAQALDFLNQKRAQLPADRLVLVGGDFNVNAGEDSQFNVWRNQMSNWDITHIIGCQGCVGTEYYRSGHEWSFLDAIAFSHNLTSGQAAWSVDAASIQIPKYDAEQVAADGTPQSFDGRSGVGVSDHFPMFAILRKH